MLKIPNKGFKRIYVYGGSGILDSIASVFSKGIVKRAASEAAKRATQLVEKAATETGKKLGEKSGTKDHVEISRYFEEAFDAVSYDTDLKV